MADDAPVVNEEVDAGTTDTGSTPAENTPEVAETPVQRNNGELILQPDTEDKEEEAAPDAEPPVDETKEEEQPQDTEPLSPKSQNRFQQLANERNEALAEAQRVRQQLEQYRVREAQVAREQELSNEVNPETGEYYTPTEIERLAFQQSKEQQAQSVAEQRYELEVQDVQFQLRDEATRALTDFPMFDEQSPDYDPELAASADELLGANIVQEQGTGRIIGSNVSPYKIYQTVAKAAEKSRVAGQIKGQQATERMLASVDGTGSSQKGETSFEKLSTAEMAARLRKAGHDV